MKRLVIFASGEGTNANRIMEHFCCNDIAKVILLVTNRPCGAVSKALFHSVPVIILDRLGFFRDPRFIKYLKDEGTDLIVLAGFLWLVPPALLQAFPGKVINIHPALLPKFGGRGMYGKKVHEAVIRAGEKESGISIHEVNEHFDEGKILFQSKCTVDPGETADSLAKKIHELEYQHFPGVISGILSR